MGNVSENIIAKNIRRMREDAGLTQKELADKLYVSDNVVSKWERGESLPDSETVARLAEIFGVEAGAIVYDGNDVRTDGTAERTRRRLPHNAFTLLCIVCIIASAVALFVLSVRAYISLPETIGIHFGADGKTDLYGSKAMLFMCPAVSTFFAVTCIVSNVVKITWKVNMGLTVYIDDVFKDEVSRKKIYKLLSAGINVTLLVVQSLFLLLGCCMALQISVPFVAMWIIVALVIVVPVVFMIAGFVSAVRIRETENSAK